MFGLWLLPLYCKHRLGFALGGWDGCRESKPESSSCEPFGAGLEKSALVVSPCISGNSLTVLLQSPFKSWILPQAWNSRPNRPTKFRLGKGPRPRSLFISSSPAHPEDFWVHRPLLICDAPLKDVVDIIRCRSSLYSNSCYCLYFRASSLTLRNFSLLSNSSYLISFSATLVIYRGPRHRYCAQSFIGKSSISSLAIALPDLYKSSSSSTSQLHHELMSPVCLGPSRFTLSST